jgi:hypothetical protein
MKVAAEHFGELVLETLALVIGEGQVVGIRADAERRRVGGEGERNKRQESGEYGEEQARA